MNFKFFKRSRNQKRSIEQISNGEGSASESSWLDDLCLGDRMLSEALSHFLIYEPKRQLPLLDSSETFYKRGLEEEERGNQNLARSNFEEAARIEICKLNLQKAREYLLAADRDSTLPVHVERHSALLSNMDKVRSIAEKYYRSRDQLVAEAEEKPLQVITR